MTTIINAEFYKLKFNIGLKLLPLAAVIMALVTVGFMLFVSGGATVEGEAFTVTDVFGFEPAGRLGAGALATLSNLYGFIAAVFAGLFISTEFSQGTIRNALCVGVSRTNVYLSKLSVSAVLLALCMFLSCMTFIAGFTVTYGFGNGAGFLRDTLTVLFMQFLYHFTYAGIGCLLAFLIPNIVMTVAIGIIIVVASGILVEICSAFDVLNGIAPFIPQYYVTRLNSELHNPLFLAMGAAVSIGFVTLTALIGCVLFNRQDIK
ncbi:MAG: ABC transporter permease [Treponema sp.]|jgi:ABC-2 type transport system permease protein|nr:ABC transporter permease [Treponema sp.]